MNKRVFFPLALSIALLLFSASCFKPSEPNPKTSSQMRLNLPNWGIVIDANYDTKLDGVVPGYKIITVALTNRSIDMIRLDQGGDQWFIEDAWGRKQKGIVSLRLRDPQVWTQLPPRVKDIIEYPGGVQMGYTQTFDLFFPQSIDLDHFRAISFYSAALKQNFDALSASSMNRGVPASEDPNAEPVEKYLPKNSSGSAKKPRNNPNANAKYN